MKNKFMLGLIVLLISPCCVFAMPINDYFQQDVTVVNSTKQNILVTDPASIFLNRDTVAPGYYDEITFQSDQFTVSPAQSFSHVVTINSAVDGSLICTVTSDLEISLTSFAHHAKSSDENKCQTSLYTISEPDGIIYAYGFLINVI